MRRQYRYHGLIDGLRSRSSGDAPDLDEALDALLGLRERGEGEDLEEAGVVGCEHDPERDAWNLPIGGDPVAVDPEEVESVLTRLARFHPQGSFTLDRTSVGRDGRHTETIEFRAAA